MRYFSIRDFEMLQLFDLAITACSNNSISIPTLKFGGLRGNVSMTKESKFDAVEKFGEFFPDDLDEVIIVEYDNDVNQVKYGVNDAEGDYIFKLEQIYDDGLLVSEIQKYWSKTVRNVVVDRKKNYIKLLRNEGSEDESSSELFYNGLSYKEVDKEGNIVTEMECDKGDGLLNRNHILTDKLSVASFVISIKMVILSPPLPSVSRLKNLLL